MSNTYYSVSAPTQYVDVDGVKYAYRTLGQNTGIPLVCFQHFTGTLDNWDPLIVDGLAADRQVIIFDNRGVGNSGGETPDNVTEMSEDALKFIQALGIEKFDILGFSLGGFIAQYLVSQYPQMIRKIIMVGTAPQGAKVLHAFPALIEKAMQLTPQERFLFIFFEKSASSRAKGMATLGRLYERKENRDVEASLQAVQAQMTAITNWGKHAVSIDLSTITHPVLIIQGSNDEMMDSVNTFELFRQIPNALASLYPDSAHGSFYQYPELFVEQARYFLNRY